MNTPIKEQMSRIAAVLETPKSTAKPASSPKKVKKQGGKPSAKVKNASKMRAPIPTPSNRVRFTLSEFVNFTIKGDIVRVALSASTELVITDPEGIVKNFKFGAEPLTMFGTFTVVRGEEKDIFSLVLDSVPLNEICFRLCPNPTEAFNNLHGMVYGRRCNEGLLVISAIDEPAEQMLAA